MKTIRRGTFETNSSSCHSITFNNSGTLNTEGLEYLEASASGTYCGSDNYQYEDSEYGGYTYDAGAVITDLQKKFDYAMVCYAEYLNYRAMHEDKRDWYAEHPDEAKKYQKESDWRIPLPEDVYNVLVEDYNRTRDDIVNTFERHGILVDWKIPEPTDFNTINTRKGYDGQIWIDDFLSIDGAIDHDSSCSQHSEDAWRLAELCHNPEGLFEFIFIPTNEIFIQYCG